MRRRAAIWMLLILFALILYLFSNESVTLALLLALIAAMPVSFAVLRSSSKKLEFAIREAGGDGSTNSFVLSMKNGSVLPVASAEIEVRCRNLRTGETDSCLIQRGIMPKKTVEVSLDVTPVHAGRYELAVLSSRVSDPLGIWKKVIPCEGSRSVTILPEIFDMQMLSAGGAAMPETESDSGKTVGAVSGDMIGIREYVPGDPVRNIHWKLSEKTDKLLVKELGNPVADHYLLVMDSTPDISHDPAALDMVASVYTSLIHSMLQMDMVVYAGWADPVSGESVVQRVADDEEFRKAADGFLAVPAVSRETFKTGVGDDSAKYAHIVFVGTKIPADIEDIANGRQATVLVYGSGSSFTERNLTVIGFEPGTYKLDTAGIEV